MAEPSGLSRRQFLAGVSLLPVAGAISPALLAEALAATSGPFVFFTERQAVTVREATARLIPGPDDDPLEAGHPGAREANVVRYIDTLLGAFRTRPGAPPRIHAGGPFSDRAGGRVDDMAVFVPVSRIRLDAWRKRVTMLQRLYREGVVLLDRMAGGDFAAVSGSEQDQILASEQAGEFRDVLFSHAIEGTYCVPEYGGNAALSGWREIGFRGDVQPRGYTPAEVSESDGPDPAPSSPIVQRVLAEFDAVAAVVAAQRRGR